jgi:hypothetical protein
VVVLQAAATLLLPACPRLTSFDVLLRMRAELCARSFIMFVSVLLLLQRESISV